MVVYRMSVAPKAELMSVCSGADHLLLGRIAFIGDPGALTEAKLLVLENR
jgi:hypothetical protein